MDVAPSEGWIGASNSPLAASAAAMTAVPQRAPYLRSQQPLRQEELPAGRPRPWHRPFQVALGSYNGGCGGI